MLQRVFLPFGALALLCVTPAFTQEVNAPLLSELETIDAQIADAEAVIQRYGEGLISNIAAARRENLLLLRSILEVRIAGDAAGLDTEIVVPALVPNPEQAQIILGEIASQQQVVDSAQSEAAVSGGLIQAIAMGRVETEKLKLAQLQMAYIQAQYGLPMAYASSVPATNSPDRENADSSAPDVQGPSDGASADALLAWADPEYPEIDYSLEPFVLAHTEGDQISGWWVIGEERAAIDDTLSVTAINWSNFRADRISQDRVSLIARCREGQTALIYFVDEYLLNDVRSSRMPVTYRIDGQQAVETRWSEVTSNSAVGLFGTEAESFLRSLIDAEQIFLRVTERTGQTHDAVFDLSGSEKAISSVANACGWSTLELTRSDYRAIQEMLNAAGFDAGSPDGIWGSGSRAALSQFQAQQGLAATGAPNRETIDALNGLN